MRAEMNGNVLASTAIFNHTVNDDVRVSGVCAVMQQE